MMFRLRMIIVNICQLIVAVCAAMLVVPAAEGQIVQQAVGGVLIDSQGMLRQLTAEQRAAQFERLQRQLAAVPDDLATESEIRKVSLRKLDEQLAATVKRGQPVSDELRYLGGLQRVEYVMVFPDERDILLIGPGGGWEVTESGAVVGTNSGLPVILLDDLIVALRSSTAARETAISCSIDPTPEGRVALNEFLSKQKRFHQGIMKAAERILGPQQISLTGVSKESHFAQVLVAADYRMKRIAMHLEESPVAEIPSFLELAKQRRGAVTDLMPRWWLACDYEPLARSDDGLTWQLRGNGVKAMTEDQIIHADGSVEQAGTRNPVAEEWATKMTAHYEALCAVEPVFGQLRNIMDLSVVAALIQHQELLAKADCELPLLTSPQSDALLRRWSVPQWVETQTSVVKKGRSFILTASGGVQLDPWYYASRAEVTKTVTTVRGKVQMGDSWRWD